MSKQSRSGSQDARRRMLCSPDLEPDRQQQIQTESLSRTQKWMDCPQVDPHRASQATALRLFGTEDSRVENSPSQRWTAAAEPVAQPRAQNMQTGVLSPVTAESRRLAADSPTSATINDEVGQTDTSPAAPFRMWTLWAQLPISGPVWP